MVAGINLIAVLSPGPDFVITLRNALIHGVRAGLLTAVGIALGLSVHVLYTLAGLSLLIAQSVVLFSVVKLLGAAYLIWMGLQAIRARPRDPSADAAAGASGPDRRWRGGIVSGFLTNVLNPKAALYMLALFTQIIDPATSTLEKGLYGLTLMVESLLVFGLLALLIGQPAVRRAYGGAAHWIDRALGAVFIGLGVRLALARAAE
nr:LysE family transporter [Roseospira visakhapatnamensis]